MKINVKLTNVRVCDGYSEYSQICKKEGLYDVKLSKGTQLLIISNSCGILYIYISDGGHFYPADKEELPNDMYKLSNESTTVTFTN